VRSPTVLREVARHEVNELVMPAGRRRQQEVFITGGSPAERRCLLFSRRPHQPTGVRSIEERRSGST
jgi:hypothetical protein